MPTLNLGKGAPRSAFLLFAPVLPITSALILTTTFFLAYTDTILSAERSLASVTETTRVRQVLDGDSVILEDGRELRLIGINAPEYGKKRKAPEPLAREAHAALARLIEGQAVILEVGREPTDRYGRTLAHMRLTDGTDVQEALLKRGLAWLVAIPPNVAHVKRLQAAEHEARIHHRGVWGLGVYAPKPAEQLTLNDTGFRLVLGTVRRIGQSRKYWYLDLSPSVSIQIPRVDWEQYFSGKPQDLLNRRVVARGWWTVYRGRLRVRVRHPAMLTLSDSS